VWGHLSLEDPPWEGVEVPPFLLFIFAHLFRFMYLGILFIFALLFRFKPEPSETSCVGPTTHDSLLESGRRISRAIAAGVTGSPLLDGGRFVAHQDESPWPSYRIKPPFGVVTGC